MADPTSRITENACPTCGRDWSLSRAADNPISRITTLTVRDRQALTTALLLLEAYQAKYGWMWTEGISGEDVAAAARSVVEHAE
jgi:hypothetical protein